MTLLVAVSTASAERLDVQLERAQVFWGSPGRLVATVFDQAEVRWPIVEPVEGLRIEAGGGPQLMIVNGLARRIYAYHVFAEKPGIFEIPKVSLTVDGQELNAGPFKLQVIEAPMKYFGAKIEPGVIIPQETARLTVAFEGYRPDEAIIAPEIDGLAIRTLGEPQIQPEERTGVPITYHFLSVTALKLGAYRITGISFAGLPAEPIDLQVSPFVVLAHELSNSSLEVGSSAVLKLQVRGLSADDRPTLSMTGTATAELAQRPMPARGNTTLFPFRLTPTEPGNLILTGVADASGNPPPTLFPPLL